MLAAVIVASRNWYGLSDWKDPVTGAHYATCNVSIGCVDDKVSCTHCNS